MKKNSLLCFISVLLCLGFAGCYVPDFKSTPMENFHAGKVGSDLFCMSWDYVPDAQKYDIYYINSNKVLEQFDRLKSTQNNFCLLTYAANLTSTAKGLVVAPVGTGKRSFVAKVSESGLSKYYSTLEYDKSTGYLTWSAFPSFTSSSSSGKYCLIRSTNTENDSYKECSVSSAKSNGAFYNTEYAYNPNIYSNYNTYYAVFVYYNNKYQRMTDWYSGNKLTASSQTGTSNLSTNR